MLFRKDTQGVSAIVVFLGNPGAKYNGTRHNVGFMTADAYEKAHSVRIDRLKFHALTATCRVGGTQVLLMKPQTYMNLSGDAVRPAMDFYKVPTENIIVISDDVSLPVGKMRIRRSGSAGGHNGLKDIIAKCGGEGFPRIKVGVGAPPHPDYEMADWVLGTFKNEDAKIMADMFAKAAEAVDVLLADGIDKAMAKFN